MSNILMENYSKNLPKCRRTYSVAEVFIYLNNGRQGRSSRTTALKYTLLSSIIGTLPNIKQHKRYL